MKLVAIVQPVTGTEEAVRAVADAAGLTLAEVRMRLAPEPPLLLARLEPAKADLLVGTLRRAGLAALAVDARCPTDKDRTSARSFVMDDAGITFTPRLGEPAAFAWTEVLAVLRGIRASRTDLQLTQKSSRLSIGTAVVTGGLKMTRTSAKTTRSSQEDIEQVILVYAHDGRAAMLAERELEFSSLGTGMQPSSTANMLEIARRLRERAKSAFHDERLTRLGRRPLPFLAAAESRSYTATTATTHIDTSSSLDTLAEVMRRALTEGLLP